MVWWCPCCPEASHSSEVILLTSSPLAHNYTVRRISSFGETYINEKGEEEEVARHGTAAPWRPSPVQPGVTHTEVAEQVSRMPSIEEVSPRPVRRWNKNASSYSTLPHKQQRQTDNEKYTHLGITAGLSSIMSVSSPDLADQGGMHAPLQFRRCSAVAVSRARLRSITGSNTSDDNSSLGGEEKESVNESLARQYGLDLSLYSGLEAECGPPAQFPNLGNVHLTAHYTPATAMTTITVERLEGLPCHGTDNSPHDIVIKLSIGSKTACSTPVTINMPVNQAFSLPVKDPDTSVLRLSVYQPSWQENLHDAIGHALLKISSLRTLPSYYSLEFTPMTQFEQSGAVIHLNYSYHKEELHMQVTKVSEIPQPLREGKVYAKVSWWKEGKRQKEKVSRPVTVRGPSVDLDFETQISIGPPDQPFGYLLVRIKRKHRPHPTNPFSDRTIGSIKLGPTLYKGPPPSDKSPWGQALLSEANISLPYKLLL